MPSTSILEHHHYVPGIYPVADALAGTVASDVVNMSNYGKCTFILFVGVGATGTSTITVEACDDVVPTTTSAITFHYRQVTSGDTEGALTAAAATGFATTAGSNRLAIVEVSAQDLAPSGYKYCRLKAVEVVDSPVLGGILIELSQPRYGKSAKPTAIV